MSLKSIEPLSVLSTYQHRRALGQWYAHLTLSVSTPGEANVIIRVHLWDQNIHQQNTQKLNQLRPSLTAIFRMSGHPKIVSSRVGFWKPPLANLLRLTIIFCEIKMKKITKRPWFWAIVHSLGAWGIAYTLRQHILCFMQYRSWYRHTMLAENKVRACLG